MLCDASDTPNGAELSIASHYSVQVLLQFVDKTISGFRPYYFSIPDVSVDENAISYHLATYFNASLIDEEGGFIPYRFNFVKNPPQPSSRKETDIGVVILNKSKPGYPIIEFEAKRLSDSSNNSEYVYGVRGGLARFKRNEHGVYLHTCGMFGYVQNDISSVWIKKINGWITSQAAINADDLDWAGKEELLVHSNSFEKVDKWCSINSRKQQSSLTIYHYFIDLVK